MKRSIRPSRKTATKLSHHLRELQIRLLVSVVALGVVGVIVYRFYGPILELLRSPLNAPLYYSSPAGSFAFVMKICFMGALAVTIPVIVYNIIMFVRPAFEKVVSIRRVYITTAASAVLAISGAVFGFIFIIPGTLHFFAGFQVDGLNALISADSYLSFVTNVIITFVIVFQLPLLIAFIDSIKPLSPQDLMKMNKWVVVASLVISLLVPFAFDLTTSLLIAAPIVVLYNLSIILVVAQHAHAASKVRSAARAATPARQVLDLSSMVVATQPLDDQQFDGFVSELESLDQPIRVQATVPVKRVAMDIMPRNARPPVIVSTALASSRMKATQATEHVRVISDMVRVPNPNRALTSQ